jgi:hypothetical protein
MCTRVPPIPIINPISICSCIWQSDSGLPCVLCACERVCFVCMIYASWFLDYDHEEHIMWIWGPCPQCLVPLGLGQSWSWTVLCLSLQFAILPHSAYFPAMHCRCIADRYRRSPPPLLEDCRLHTGIDDGKAASWPCCVSAKSRSRVVSNCVLMSNCALVFGAKTALWV